MYLHLKPTFMRTLRTTALLVATSTMLSCVSTDSIMGGWVGQPISEAIVTWGSPDSTTQLDDGRTVYTWITLWNADTTVHTCRKSFTAGATGIIERYSFSDCRSWQLDM